MPWLYRKGISTGDFSEALAALLGRDAPGLSAGPISRLKAVWARVRAQGERRSPANKHYVYLWIDGIHFGVRLAEVNQCILVVMGASAEGKKELVALADGFRESAQSWKAVLKDASSIFHDFRAEQRIHLRTTSPIEPTFATVRLRTDKARGCVSRPSILSMVFKLVRSAECRWRALRGSELITKVTTDVQFKNGT